MKNTKEEQIKRIDLRIQKVTNEALTHHMCERPVSAALLMKTVESLNIKKQELEQ